MIKTLIVSFLGASRTGFYPSVRAAQAFILRCEPHRLFILRCEPHRLHILGCASSVRFILRSSFAHPSLNLR